MSAELKHSGREGAQRPSFLYAAVRKNELWQSLVPAGGKLCFANFENRVCAVVRFLSRARKDARFVSGWAD